MSQAIDNLTAKVAAETSVTASLRVLLQTVADELKSALANDDSAALQALSDKLSADVDANTAAVVANTPAAPVPPPAVPPTA